MYVVFVMGNSFPGWINGLGKITATTYKISSFTFCCKREIDPLRILSLRGLGPEILQGALLPLGDRIRPRGLQRGFVLGLGPEGKSLFFLEKI